MALTRIFSYLTVWPGDTFLEVERLNRVHAHVVLLAMAKFCSTGLCRFALPPAVLGKRPLPQGFTETMLFNFWISAHVAALIYFRKTQFSDYMFMFLTQRLFYG